MLKAKAQWHLEHNVLKKKRGRKRKKKSGEREREKKRKSKHLFWPKAEAKYTI